MQYCRWSYCRASVYGSKVGMTVVSGRKEHWRWEPLQVWMLPNSPVKAHMAYGPRTTTTVGLSLRISWRRASLVCIICSLQYSPSTT